MKGPRPYPGEASAQYGEFGQVTGAAALVRAGACSWEVVTAGKHHACGITAAAPGEPTTGQGAATSVGRRVARLVCKTRPVPGTWTRGLTCLLSRPPHTTARWTLRRLGRNPEPWTLNLDRWSLSP